MNSKQRPLSFLLSVALHVLWVLLLPYLPSGRNSNRGLEFPEITVIPLDERKVIWYDLRKEKIPEVSPVKPVGRSSVPTARELSNETLIALLPKAPSGRQLIWQPPLKIEIAQPEIRAPNLVLVQPAPPPPPEKKPTPRAFVPPGPTITRETSPALIEAAPEIVMRERSLEQVKLPMPAGMTGPPKPKPKAFVPPGPTITRETSPALIEAAPEIAMRERSLEQVKLPVPAGIAGPPKPKPKAFVPPGPTLTRETSPALIAAAPEIAMRERSLEQVKPPVPSGITGPPKPKPKAFVPPPSRASGAGQGPGGGDVLGAAPPPELGVGAAGDVAKVNLAIIGIDPSEQMKVGLPAGARAAQFSKAPVIGEPSTGGSGGEKGVKMPGVRVGGEVAAPKVPAVPNPSTRELVVEMSVPSHALTVAAPLRPSARQIPRLVEERFHGRNVYTLIVPPPRMPMYTGDWVIWFAEMAERPGEIAQMRSPVPLRKHILLGANADEAGTPAEGSLRFSAVIQRDGKITRIALAGVDSAGLAGAAVKDLSGWQFRAATRNGQAVDVEVMIQIPFRLSLPAGR